jgi:YggT family protein
MNIVFVVARYALEFFILVMWVRLIIDFVRSAKPDWRPQSFVLVLLSAMYAITDPPLKVVRKVVKPVRFGAVAIDFAWTIVLIVAIILLNVVAGFARAY